jgi:FHA domain-containing protein
MITIEVIAKNGVPLASPLAADFDELGGNIGRAEDATLVLADPERIVSRTHAAVGFRGGRYLLYDLGTAVAVHVNGRALGNGREAPIQPGDEIRIGPYELRVKAAAAAPREPAAAANGLGQFDEMVGTSGSLPDRPRDDPLALFSGGGFGASANPFEDLVAPASPPKAAPAAVAARATASPEPRRGPDPVRRAAPAAPAEATLLDDPFAISAQPPASQAPSAGGIPDDFDPFAAPPAVSAPAAVPAGSVLPEDLDLGRLADGMPDIDRLFELGPGAGADPFAPGHPLAEPLHQPNTTARDDPLASLRAAPMASARPTRADHTPEIRSAFTPPKPRPDPVQSVDFDLNEPDSDATPAAAKRSMFVSWDDAPAKAGKLQTVVIPVPQAPRETPAAPGSESTVIEEDARERRVDFVARMQREEASVTRPRVPTPTPSARAGQPTQPNAVGDAAREELLRAFLAGAGVPDLEMPGTLTPQLMGMFGQLLRTATQGTLDLLRARAIAKRELRADVTMIMPRENNPLKFSPSVEAALAHLLAPKGAGFMTPIRAVQDAYDDLRAHQVAFMAGMRAALAGVLARFDPEELEGRLTRQNLIDSLVPMTRRAKLWDLFIELYGEIAREATDDFHALFGREFLHAYEAQLSRLALDRNRGRPVA